MKVLVFISLFYSAVLYGQDYSKIRITTDYALWTRPYFTNAYAVQNLKSGTEAEILRYEKKSEGYGVEIRITTDPNKGKTGWVYYHTASNRRKLTFLDDRGKIYNDISTKSSEFMQHFKEQEEKLEQRQKKMALMPANNDDINDTEKVLENIKNGIYIIDSSQDDGGPFIPVIRTVQKKDGTKALETFHIPRSYSSFISIAEQINKGLYLDFNSICKMGEQSYTDDNHEVIEDTSRFTKGCELLAKDSKSWDDEKLKLCLDNLRAKLGGNNKTLNRKSIFQKMFALEPEEQEFIGSVLTLYGESRSSTDEESLIVLQTFENRKNGAQKKCKNANLLDVVLQSWQFSMWNNNDPNWKKAISLKEEEKAPPAHAAESFQLKRMAGLYKKFKNNDFKIAASDKKKVEKISHYRTRAMDRNPSSVPSWGTAQDSISTIRVNQMNLGSQNRNNSNVDHYFFEDVAWKFKFHPYRPKKSGDVKCY